jgi:hypothetical protein
MSMYRAPFNSSAPPAQQQHLAAHPAALSENEPIDQFIQSGGEGYFPSYGTPSEQDYFSLFAEFAMDLTPPPSMKSNQQPPTLSKTGLAPTYSTTAVPPDALNANRKRKTDSNGKGTAPTTKKAAQAKAAPKKTKKDVVIPSDDDGEDFEGGEGDTLPDREKRLLKNRKAAQQFRKRQKNHILDLEGRVETLTTENSTLTSQVELLHTENKLIREQLDYMRSFVLNALQFTFPPSLPTSDLQRTITPLALSRPDPLGDKESSSGTSTSRP